MSAYYNEHDAFAAAWLRELIKAGLISDGEVDERDIQQVEPGDLRGFTQCHFFAGIGVWSYALRNAGWPDDLAVWTGSCPCQGFSASGKRGGFSDQRHLWPAWFRLIAECRPDTVFGEQVASKDGLAWFDVVSADMEGTGYAVGAADTCAAGFGAPHIRSRLYFVAESERRGRDWSAVHLPIGRSQQTIPMSTGAGSDVLTVADTERHGRRPGLAGREAQGRDAYGRDCQAGQLANTADTRCNDARQHGSRPSSLPARSEQRSATGELGHPEHHGRDLAHGEPAITGGDGQERGLPDGAGLTNGFWRDAQWLWCRDGKYRPVEPGTFPLAHGIAKRVGKLRGFGNAIVAPQAEEFVRAFLGLSERAIP